IMFPDAQALTRTLLPIVLLALSTPWLHLHAQVCTGFAPLDDARYRISASTARYRYANAHGLSLTAGDAVYATVGTTLVHDDEVSTWSYGGGLEVGADVRAITPNTFFCPVASLSYETVPLGTLLLLEGVGIQALRGEAGLGLAWQLDLSHRVEMSPALSVRVARVRARLERAGAPVLTRRDEDFYVVGSAAAGLTIGRLTVRPGVTIPMGLADDRERYYVRPFGRENRE